MNDARRKRIKDITARLSGLRAELEDLEAEERDAFDNLPESLQAGERGQAGEAAAETLQSAIDALEEVESSLDEAAV